MTLALKKKRHWIWPTQKFKNGRHSLGSTKLIFLALLLPGDGLSPKKYSALPPEAWVEEYLNDPS
jgi:hypothetical protein